MKPFRIGVVGCGQISNQYLSTFTEHFGAVATLEACADLDSKTAKAAAEQHGANRACAPEEIYSDSSIDVVLNLTNPWAHTEVNLSAITAGKHVYAEKPLALERDGARKVLDAAKDAGVRVGCAPDTFLGAGIQTCIKLLDEGWIGTPTAAHASITMSLGVNQRYNSNRIGGVLMDMGPYYLTALVAMFGPALRVAGFARRSSDSATVTDMTRSDYGETGPIEAATTAAGSLEFANGVYAHLTATVDSHTYGPHLSVIGTEGVLTCNDPNMFGGSVTVARAGNPPREMPLTHAYNDRNRGLGLVEMMAAAEAGRPHRASGELAFHVMDIALSLIESGQDGSIVELERVCERPEPVDPKSGRSLFA